MPPVVGCLPRQALREELVSVVSLGGDPAVGGGEEADKNTQDQADLRMK